MNEIRIKTVNLAVAIKNKIVMQTATEQSIRNFLLNKTVSGIEFFIINEKYYVFDEARIWVIDAGVEIGLGEERFCFCWDPEKEIYAHHFGKMADLLDDVHPADLDDSNPAGIKSLVGQKITDVQMQWNWYSDLDENFEPLEHKNYIPVELIITFENGHTLQLAAVDYGIDVVNKKMKNVVFDSERSFLVTLNHVMKIDTENELGDEIEERV